MMAVINAIEAARADGLQVSADIYPYVAGGTGLAASIPPEYQRGGIEAMRRRLRSQPDREAIAATIHEGGDWESLWDMSGGGEGVVVLSNHPEIGVRSGTSIAVVARERGDSDPVSTMLDIVEAAPYAMAAYFIGNEDNIRLAFQRPWVSVGSDSPAHAAEPMFEDDAVHPRGYGAFARVLGRYAREEGLVPMHEAVHRMTLLPARALRLADRGELRPGAYADVAAFDPDEIIDNATYANPAVYASGMRHVFVNGRAALLDGAPTGALAGRALRRAQA